MRWWLALCLTGLLVPARALAAEFWVDPVHGKTDADGSASSPWRSLQEVLDRGLVESRGWESLPYKEGAKLVAKNAGAPIEAGDTIYLRSGYYGDLAIVGYYNASDIHVVAEHGHTPRFRSVLVRAGSHWVFGGLHISPESAPKYERTLLFGIESHVREGPISDIIVQDCYLQSVEDSSKWSPPRIGTNSRATDFEARGKNVILRKQCAFRNVNFGISVDAADSLIEGNLVENFAGDGMRGFGARSVFQYNTVKNTYNVNDNHDDGFQSWSFGEDGVGTGEVVGIVLRGNTFINHEDPNQPHRGTLQGIGCFDGSYVGWTIENNEIIEDHWNGITLFGARDSRIVNNTVVDARAGDPGPPWIMIGPHKDGTPSTGNIVRNNLAGAINVDGPGTVADHNLIITNKAKLFKNAREHDLHLKAGARAIDAGSSAEAPDLDRDKVPRPLGKRYDIGAYEYHEDKPVDNASSSEK